ncbi:hypothetical protein BGZ65_003968 [Modicella reniformis]|uniref:FAD-binding domain-containing protein n=1 Tax=Modicella reniformis TaxID=1440133 RepID=A0A9P6LU00_9FUNG|nr:hypothetical protein BGZ65_003968 [Modicella reniformis]
MPVEHPLITPPERPKVLIVGAGLGGLTLAILLEKAGVPYEVYDRVAEIKPLGSALSLGHNVAPLFQQIGIYEEFVELGTKRHGIDNYNENRQLEFSLDLRPLGQMGGFDGYIISRSTLYDLLHRQVPAEKIHLGKRLLSLKQNEHGVQIHFADRTVVEGDILVGADGAYSGVRQSLYQNLKKEGQLPSSDDGALPFSCICLVGQTTPLDPEKYPELLDDICHFRSVIAEEKPYSWSSLTTKNNIYCWGVIQYLDEGSSKDNDSFRNSEWGPEAAQTMCKEVRNFPLPGGVNNDLTMGDLIDNTLPQYISKVMLEEKVFDTWYYGRTVLIGDACHKIHPASGVGAVHAMQDAVALANWISVLNTTTIEAAEKIFEEYKAERFPVVKAAFNNGRGLSQITARDLKARIIRYITKNMPSWLWRIMLRRMAESRPQVSFLPEVKDGGTVPPKYQPSLAKTLAIHRARANKEELIELDYSPNVQRG